MNKPELIVVGGANGSGKTTFALEYSQQANLPHLGADELARQMAPDNVVSVKVAAGKQFIQQLKQALVCQQSLVVETTLSGKSVQHWIQRAKDAGYNVSIFFVYLDSPDLCILRIKERVRKGGHHVPESDVRRRFSRSLTNFWELYRPLADNWMLVYNQGEATEVIATGTHNQSVIINTTRLRDFLNLKK